MTIRAHGTHATAACRARGRASGQRAFPGGVPSGACPARLAFAAAPRRAAGWDRRAGEADGRPEHVGRASAPVGVGARRTCDGRSSASLAALASPLRAAGLGFYWAIRPRS